MEHTDWLNEQFEQHRSHLRAVAYRMLGSLSDADDAVQDAWLRFSRADTSDVENLRAWLTTVVARVSLNMLRSRQTRREEGYAPHMPDPIIDSPNGTDPEHQALLADSVGVALLVVLDTLSPPERLAFVLHDIFAVPFDEIAPIVDRTPEAARQLASRARRRVQGEPTVPDTDLEPPASGRRRLHGGRPQRRFRSPRRRARPRGRRAADADAGVGIERGLARRRPGRGQATRVPSHRRDCSPVRPSSTA